MTYTYKPTKYFPLLTSLTDTIPRYFPPTLVEAVIIHPYASNHCLEWLTHFPKVVRENSEWLIFGDEYDEAYKNWGVNKKKGALAIIRPDGYVGAVTEVEGLLAGTAEAFVEGYLEKLLKRAET